MAATAVLAVGVLGVVLGVLAPLACWLERKQAALMQDRVGPNRADLAGLRLLGLLQPVADFAKLAAKADAVPDGASRALYALAPLVSAVPVWIAFAVVPIGSSYAFGATPVDLVVADPDWGILFVLALGAVAAWGELIAGWSCRDDFAFLGGVRSAARTISFQIALAFSLAGVLMVYGSLKLTDAAAAQDTTFRALGFVELAFHRELGALGALRLPQWGIFLQPLGFLLFLTCSLALSRRPPFDVAEANSELVGGYRAAYSGLRLALFEASDFLQAVVSAGLIVTLFLGGWSLPYLSQQTIVESVGALYGDAFANGLCLLLHVGAFLAKVVAVMALMVALGSSLSRFRYDQAMHLCWKVLLPLSIANVFVTGIGVLAIRGVQD